MKVLKPPWVHHNGKPIYSVDIHPDGSRFATAGQGEASGQVVIWNLSPVSHLDKELDPKTPKLLCKLDNHYACVNCVRWSNSGTLLASAGDDKLIMIWRYAGGASKTFGSDHDNTETWRCIHTLRGHSGDVLDIAWSPQDLYLASCSVDNTVVIWNAGKFPEQIKVLQGHTSMVKGVAWDPVGKYMASQSDDRTAIVWRTRDWQRETTVTKPFEESSGTTHVLRLSWSPDGGQLVSAHAMNNMGPTAQIIERNGWKTEMDFVGHRKAVTCVRFNPKILSRKVKRGNSERVVNYCCCAVGSRDSSCSIWLTSLRRPLVVLHEMFDNSIPDVAWSSDGTQLLICSTDGTVAYIEFTADELGTVLSEEEKTKLMHKMYGKSVVVNGNTTHIIESTAMLKLHQHASAVNSTPPSNGLATPLSSNGTSAEQKPLSAVLIPVSNGLPSTSKEQQHTAGSLNPGQTTQHSLQSPPLPLTPSKQIETRTKDGRRRITPIFLSPPPAISEIVPPQPLFTTSKEASKIVVECSLDKMPTQVLSPGRPAKPEGPSVEVPAVQPMVMPTSADESSAESVNSMFAIKPMTSSEAQGHTPKDKTVSALPLKDTPKSVQPESAEKEVVNRIAVKRKVLPRHKSGKLILSKKTRRNKELPAEESPPPEQPKEPVLPLPVLAKQPLLPVPEVKKTHTFKITLTDSYLLASITNDIACGSTTLHKLRCVLSPDCEWEVLFNSQILDVQGSRTILCTSCKERRLHAFTVKGQQLLRDLILDSDISTIKVCDDLCMVVTCAGFLSLWDFSRLQCLIKSVELHSATRGLTLHITRCFLTPSGTPVITVSNGDTFIYHTDLQSWLMFSQGQDSVRQHSDQEILAAAVKNTADFGVVSVISKAVITQTNSVPSVGRVEGATQLSCTLSSMQSQIALCRLLRSPKELHYWLLTYVRYLTQHDKEDLIRQLCFECVQSLFATKSTPKSNYLMDINRKELLQEILPIVGSNLKLQRLYTEYSELLDAL